MKKHLTKTTTVIATLKSDPGGGRNSKKGQKKKKKQLIETLQVKTKSLKEQRSSDNELAHRTANQS